MDRVVEVVERVVGELNGGMPVERALQMLATLKAELVNEFP